MLFNSGEFIVFLPIVFILYWFVTNRSLKLQNILLLIASYFFYACWDWRFMFLLAFSTILDYVTGLKMSDSKSHNTRKFWFILSISINLGFLGVFKYYNFFIDSFVESLAVLGHHIDPARLNIILPIGISFYTFHGLSYVIDIYKNRIQAEKNFVDYSVFVSFFPLLVAGPIERATHLLPQIQKKRTFDKIKAVDGLRQILWGLFKKVVIADQCAEYVNLIFAEPANHSGSTLCLSAILFSFQIYCDFSGYSDIALGTARLFGIELLRNFAYPYFSRDIAEFWRRWHISLSTWFRDYLYIPLGGSKGNLLTRIRNTFIIFIVSGFWHGANWTFIIWGFLNALYIIPSIVFHTNRKNLDIVAYGKFFPSLRDLFAMSLTFTLTTFAWIFFRSENMTHAIHYISTIGTADFFPLSIIPPKETILFLFPFLLIEWIGRDQQYALARFGLNWRSPLRYALYYVLVFAIMWFGDKEQQFIYFQF